MAGVVGKLEVVHYARKYLSFDRDGYHKTWYKLHMASDSEKWPNVLLICELLFTAFLF